MTKILCSVIAASLFFSIVKPTLAVDTNAPAQTMTLQDCLDLALKQNPTILKAQQEIRRAKGVIVETRAAGVPQITASGSGQMIDKQAIDAFKFTTTNHTTATSTIF